MNNEILSERVTRQILLFRDFLVKSWSTFDDLMENHDWDNDTEFNEDWMEVNWEFLIERELLGKGKFITPLSGFLGSRVLPINKKFDFSVVTFAESDLFDLRFKKTIPKGTRLRLRGFLAQIKPGVFGFYPPFDFGDFIIDNKKKEYPVPPLENFKFYLEPFNPDHFK